MLKHTAVFSFRSGWSKKLNCVNLATWFLYLQGKCAIYGSQMVPGFSVELQYLSFLWFLTVFCFSSQLLRSLNAFWSWGWPENLRTYTNAPEKQTNKATGFHWSLVSVVPFLLWLVLFCVQVITGTYSGVLSLPPFVFLLFIAHVWTGFHCHI